MIALIYVLAYMTLDYFSGKWCLTCSSLAMHRHKIFSFIAGLMLADLFFVLLPHSFSTKSLMPYLATLGAFSLFFFLHVHLKRKHANMYVYKEAHLSIRALYHFILGAILVSISTLPLKNSLLLAVPIMVASLFSTLSIHQVHHVKKAITKRLWLLDKASWLTPLMGLAFATFIPIEGIYISILFGIVSGALLHIVIREFLAEDKYIDIASVIAGQIAFVIIAALPYL